MHGPSDGVTVILELNFANCSQADGAFAAVVVIKELVGCAEVAGLAGAVVEASRHDDLVSKGEHLAPSGFEVLRGGWVWQPELSHRIVDRHCRSLLNTSWPCGCRGS